MQTPGGVGRVDRAIQAPDATMVTSAIEEVTPPGIRTAEGHQIDADLLILATGFRTHNYMRPMDLRGRDGLRIDYSWAKGPRAYRMTAIPGFPSRCTTPPSRPRATSCGGCDGSATTKFNDDVATALGPTVWNTGRHSWYLTDEGTVDLWPYDGKTMAAMLAHPDDRDFHIA